MFHTCTYETQMNMFIRLQRVKQRNMNGKLNQGFQRIRNQSLKTSRDCVVLKLDNVLHPHFQNLYISHYSSKTFLET